MVHAPFSKLNKLCGRAIHDVWMGTKKTETEIDPVWQRVMDEVTRQIGGRDRAQSALAERLNTSVQAIGNWKTRGIPPSRVEAVAKAIGWTMNQVLDVAEPPGSWPFETISRERFERLTPRQQAMIELVVLQELDRIESSGKLASAA